MSAFDDYVAAARDLAALRAADDARGGERDTWVSARRAELAELGGALHRQRTSLENVATIAGLPLRLDAQEPPPMAGVDAAAVLGDAHRDVRAADELVVETDYLAHRSPLLPRWRTDERNGLVYGLFALLGLVVQMGVIVAAASNEDTLAGRGWTAFFCLVIPFLAFGCGWLAIGVLCRPRLGDEKLVRNPRLGLAVCLSTWLVVCLVGGPILV